MKTNKTNATTDSVEDFINAFASGVIRRNDSFQLVGLMKKWTGFEPRMWGPSIIGFGSYHYRYQSGHEGDSPLIGFSPRKKAISLYVALPGTDGDSLLCMLGKHRMGKACIYVNKLDDIDLGVLEKLCKATVASIMGGRDGDFPGKAGETCCAAFPSRDTLTP